jgi:hypothetical protein
MKEFNAHKSEEWRDIPEYEGIYMVSNLGNVKSLSRITGGRKNRQINGGIMSQHYHLNGYKFVMLRKNGVSKSRRIHRLVAAAFKGASNLVVDHLDGNIENNNLENLEYVTHRENCCRGRRCDRKDGKSSELRGVVFCNGAWTARRRINKKFTYLGRYNNEIDAHEAYLLAKKTDKSRLDPCAIPKGYYFHNIKKMWHVRIQSNGEKTSFGFYEKEADAMRVAIEKYNEIKGVL